MENCPDLHSDPFSSFGVLCSQLLHLFSESRHVDYVAALFTHIKGGLKPVLGGLPQRNLLALKLTILFSEYTPHL